MVERPQKFLQANVVNSKRDAEKAVSSGMHLQETRKVYLLPASRKKSNNKEVD